MPIISIQKRLRQAGRVRIGAKVATKNGGSRPSKLESFRFTSPDETAIRTVAEVYGGEAQPWDGAAVGKQWEVFTPAVDIDVTVPPTDIAFSQWFENWSGGVCRNRCDGERDIISDGPCICSEDNPACKPTTRINLILTALEGVGVWRLEVHGWNGAAELAGSIEVLKSMREKGILVPGRLQLEQRQSKSIDKDGKVNTYNFAVPTLDFKFSVGGAITAGRANPALNAGPPVTIIPRDEEVGTPSIAEQLHASQNVAPKPARANAAATLPRTGAKPRGLPAGPFSEEDDSQGDVEVVHAPKPAADDRTPGGASKSSLRKLMAVIRGSKDVPETDDGRHEWAVLALDIPVASFNDLSQEQISHLIDVASGKKPLIPDTTAEDLSAPF